ncbi:hypothetical protein PAHAL_3G062300 [Panicum hallii]|uniref:Uncharacterized protein n=1 Tax=Panicum hallii TaxID=206008 RepID=A0A2S3H6J5_9POAL|nr:uncharacterized protein LOC112884060 [Panicum hallii]PAN16458.1 hypothetical protein PAHAL_3G062300 [Panicum hallii]
MWTSDSDPELPAAVSSTTSASPPPPPPPASLLRRPRSRRRRRRAASRQAVPAAAAPEAEDVWRGAQWEAAWPGRRDARPVLLAADAAAPGAADDGVGRSRSLTDDDLEELKGCADLGFGFSYDEIPELRGTLPALELCYSMSQRLLDDAHHQAADPAPPVTNWKISSPGDSPDEVKARLKYWAQAVACTVRLCS